MRKGLIVILFAFIGLANVHAQEVYKEIMRVSDSIAHDRKQTLEARKIATFEKDGLKYMAMRTQEQMGDSAISVVDRQAYAMYEFVNLFVKQLSRAGKENQREAVISKFKKASLENPRFNDMDKDLTLAYCNNNYPTQFSLDTDWEKALAEVRKIRQTK